MEWKRYPTKSGRGGNYDSVIRVQLTKSLHQRQRRPVTLLYALMDLLHRSHLPAQFPSTQWWLIGWNVTHIHPEHMHSTDTTTSSYFRLMAVFFRWTWASSNICDGPPSVAEENPSGIVEQCFYRPDVLPVTQPSMSEHWRESKTITLTSGMA